MHLPSGASPGLGYFGQHIVFLMLFFTELGNRMAKDALMHVKPHSSCDLYHGKCHQIYKQLQKNDKVKYTTKLMFVEMKAQMSFFAVVFLVVLKMQNSTV
jgi:putative membrane protein